MDGSNELTFRDVTELVTAKLNTYLSTSRTGMSRVVDMRPMNEISADLGLSHFLKNGGMDLDALSAFLDTYLQDSMHMHHPAFIGHQVAVPHIASAVADLLHGTINNPTSIFEMGPSAATIENKLIHWMLEKFGWHEGAGVFTHGGSMANIHAMLAARASIAPQAWKNGNPGNLVVLAPDNSHYSIARAISILGLGHESIVTIPTDRYERIVPDDIPKIIEVERTKGRQIMAVVANVGATSTGLYDPIKEIGECCQAYDCWLHLDSPHGASAILSEKYRSFLEGIELADSLIWDAHKMMQTSTLSTAVLFKQQKHLAHTFEQKGSYLFYEKENLGVDSLPYQLECTKAPLATKLFLTLAMTGEKGMGDFVTTLYDKTRTLARHIDQCDGFSVEMPVESNIICFRYQPEQFDQLLLREALIKDGHYYITTTEIHGVRHLRIVVMNTLTDLAIIQGLLKEIEQVSQGSLQNEPEYGE